MSLSRSKRRIIQPRKQPKGSATSGQTIKEKGKLRVVIERLCMKGLMPAYQLAGY